MDTSYLAQQVNTIIGQLHGLFDEIGVPNHDRETREEEVRETVAHTVSLLRPC
jgi:protein regulator of cytokinesis 1